MSHARVPGDVSAAGHVAHVPAAPRHVSPLLHLHRQEEPVRQLRRPRPGDGLPSVFSLIRPSVMLALGDKYILNIFLNQIFFFISELEIKYF